MSTCGKGHTMIFYECELCEIATLAARNAELTKALRSVEWSIVRGPYVNCPECGYEKKEGHSPSCLIAAALSESLPSSEKASIACLCGRSLSDHVCPATSGEEKK